MSNLDDSQLDAWQRKQQQNRASDAADGPSPHLKGGGGGGTSGSMDERVTRLETHMEYVRRDLDALKVGQDSILQTQQRILEKLNLLPTKNDLFTYRWQWVGGALVMVALIVGGIIGGLGWLADAVRP